MHRPNPLSQVENEEPGTGIRTPIRADRLEHHLRQCAYPEDKTKFLVDGFKFGFRLGHTSNPEDITAPNSKKANELPTVILNKLKVEIEAGRIAGPFKTPPFHPFQASPLNVREKKEQGKYRLLHDLSYPYDNRSVNANIPQNLKTVKYASVRDAINILNELPSGAYMAKCDIKDAYRLIPLHPSEYPKLGMQFQGQYYYDKFLPQGCGSSCRIFEEFSTALEAIFKFYNPGAKSVHMLDDFLHIALGKHNCEKHLQAFISLCNDIGVPLAPEKTVGPATILIFLGILLDSIARTASLPSDKLTEYREDIQAVLFRHKLTRNELESLVGKLNFAASVVPARPFLRRLIDKIYTVRKPFHQIRCTAEMRLDLHTWVTFLQNYNGTTFFRSLGLVASDAIHMASDASHQGLGARYGSKWIQARYPQNWTQFHITVLELYPIFILVSMFGHLMKNNNIIYSCDNSGVVSILNRQSSRDKTCMQIMRPLTLQLIEHNINLKAQHIAGKLNIIPDLISRFQITAEHLREHSMNPEPTPIPQHLLPQHFNIG